MNNKIKLAVAGAVLSAASVANAGIIIPAGDWTLDVNGNVNAFATFTNADKAKGTALTGGLATGEDGTGEGRNQGINTGLLPSWLGFTGTTRQNDVDVSFTISMQPGVSDNGVTGDNGSTAAYGATLWRQAFVTFGDKSWGTVKLGKDLGVFAGQAILNDMTLLGVGAGFNGTSGTVTTLGGIGTGYIYPAWKGQVSYTTPNMNGFQATIAITNPNQGSFGNGFVANAASAATAANTGLTELYQDRFGIEGQAMYSWTGDVAGKVWLSGATYDVTSDAQAGTAAQEAVTTSANSDSYTASVFDIGTNINAGNLGLTAYYYDGEGVGTTFMGANGVYNGTSGSLKKRDSDGGYLQATYVIPTGTKLGVAYGVSRLDEASGESTAALVDKNERWTVGAYHPLTKHLNLVAEWNRIESEGQTSSNKAEVDALSLGAILFF
jgi:predicted porin